MEDLGPTDAPSPEEEDHGPADAPLPEEAAEAAAAPEEEVDDRAPADESSTAAVEAGGGAPTGAAAVSTSQEATRRPERSAVPPAPAEEDWQEIAEMLFERAKTYFIRYQGVQDIVSLTLCLDAWQRSTIHTRVWRSAKVDMRNRLQSHLQHHRQETLKAREKLVETQERLRFLRLGSSTLQAWRTQVDQDQALRAAHAARLRQQERADATEELFERYRNVVADTTSNMLGRRNIRHIIQSHFIKWVSIMAAARVEQDHADRWLAHGDIMAKLWDRVEAASEMMARYCQRQNALVAAQRCISSWKTAIEMQAVQDVAYIKQVQTERDMQTVMTIYTQRQEAQAMRAVYAKLEVDEPWRMRFYFLKWWSAWQLISVADVEGRAREKHEDEMAVLVGAQMSARKQFHLEVGKLWSRYAVRECWLKFFTAWRDVKPLRKKTLMYEFLGANKKRGMPQDMWQLEAMMDHQSSAFATFCWGRKLRIEKARLFTGWRDFVEVDVYTRQFEEQRTAHKAAMVRMRDKTSETVNNSINATADQVAAANDEAFLRVIINNWLHDCQLAKMRRENRSEMKTLQADFEKDQEKLLEYAGHKLLAFGEIVAHMHDQMARKKLVQTAFGGWLFYRTLYLLEVSREHNKEMHWKHVGEMHAKSQLVEKLYQGWCNTGWRKNRILRLRWFGLWAWIRATLMSPKRHEEVIASLKYAMRMRRITCVQHLTEEGIRHTSGIFSDVYKNLLASNLLGRWAALVIERRAEKTVARHDTVREAIVDQTKYRVQQWAFDVATRASEKFALKEHGRLCFYAISRWRHNQATAKVLRAYEKDLEVYRVRAVGSSDEARKKKIRVVDVWGPNCVARHDRKTLAKIIQAWRVAQVLEGSKRKLDSAKKLVAELQVKVDRDREFYERDLDEQVSATTAAVHRVWEKFSAKRQGQALQILTTALVWKAWAAEALAKMDREKYEREKSSLKTYSQMEISAVQERIIRHEQHGRYLADCIEKLADMCLRAHEYQGRTKFFKTWYTNAVLIRTERKVSEENRRVMQDFISAEEERTQILHGKTAALPGLKNTKTLLLTPWAFKVAAGKRSLVAKTIMQEWIRLVRFNQVRQDFDEHQRMTKAEVAAVQAAHNLELRQQKRNHDGTKYSLIAWQMVARKSSLMQRCAVGWHMLIRINKAAAKNDAVITDFEQRLQAESKARAAAEAESRRRIRGARPLISHVGTQTLRGDAKSGNPLAAVMDVEREEPAKKNGFHWTHPAEKLVTALLPAVRRRLVGVLLAMLVHQPAHRRASETSHFASAPFGEDRTSTARGFGMQSAETTIVPIVPVRTQYLQLPAPADGEGGRQAAAADRPSSPAYSERSLRSATADPSAAPPQSLGRRALEKLARVRQSLLASDPMAPLPENVGTAPPFHSGLPASTLPRGAHGADFGRSVSFNASMLPRPAVPATFDDGLSEADSLEVHARLEAQLDSLQNAMDSIGPA
eukprot:TRINITY_DN36434_c0_g1_i1.p1 TRINITY_DN36434_c0_g1~~TRINITY_DN36434_c0_g1_i1.p1  ORF type:complete len:1473 (-),score=425.55 TRINITY_DN36434_c0_g1_i1:95-4513(-)